VVSREPPDQAMSRSPAGAAAPLRAESDVLAAAPRPADLRSPRIYYLHPLLAGPLADWASTLDRIATLGFDHLLLAPVFRPGGSGSILLAADYDRLHPALAAECDAEAGLARIAAEARARGLTTLLDVMPSRASAGSRAAPPPLFRAADEAVPLDPRRYAPEAGAAEARTDSDEALAGLAEWWTGHLLAWVETGIAGFRFIGLDRVPPTLMARVIGAVRQHAGDCQFLAWTPGLGVTALDGWRGIGLDFVFSSLPWWDFRSDWLWDEADRLHRVAPVIASPEAPFGQRLAATCRNPWQLQPLLRRAIGFAAAVGAGWLMPMGLEYGTVRRMDPRRDGPEDLARMAAEAPCDLTEAIIGANTMRAQESLLADPAPPRLLGAPDGPMLAVLRRSGGDAHGAGRARVLLLNADLAHRHAVAAIALNMHVLEGFVPAMPDGRATLQPGEAVLLAAEPATPIRREPDDPARSARAAAQQPRIAIEAVSPAVDDGEFPAKRIAGEVVTVEADVIADGHDVLAAALLWRPADQPDWREVWMQPRGNDRWRASFPLRRVGLHEFAIEAWRDAFGSFRDELEKKRAAGVDSSLELIEGRELIAATVAAAPAALRQRLTALVRALEQAEPAEQRRLLLSEDVAALMRAADPRQFKTRSKIVYRVMADRPLARFASWYELFPRSMSDDPARHGTFRDVIRHLPRIRDMGFDVLYFPPIHPIGRTNRKGRNNALRPAPDDPGSPYAIGSGEGGHDALHPALGTFDDFRRLRESAHEHGLELALDFAIQCAPDHPWLKQHKDWFAWRPDGSLRYAENPPKKYEDIVNVDFYAPGAVPELWQALCDVVLFWAGQGVRIFRVDNPHTKPLPFWQWLLDTVTARYPDAIFLSEAFTRPKMMYRLAKLGFTQSYTYFTWRSDKRELREYLEELTTTAREFFRPNFFVNTPDINPVFLQHSGRPGFLIRAALATTLSGLWGMYNGFELCEARALPGREEYADSEKYQIRAWGWDRPGNITREIAALNRLRRANPALQTHLGTTFLNAFNDSILYYERATPDRSNVLLVAVGLDPHNPQEADFEIPLWNWSLPDDAALEAEDLIQGSRFVWRGKRQHMRLDPHALPYAIWRVHPAP
jgi:starch synthase (maltosyl-transferring)